MDLQWIVNCQARPMWRRVHWCLPSDESVPTQAKPVCLSILYSSWISGPHAIAGSYSEFSLAQWPKPRLSPIARGFFSRSWTFLAVAGDCPFFSLFIYCPALCAHLHHRHKNHIHPLSTVFKLQSRLRPGLTAVADFKSFVSF